MQQIILWQLVASHKLLLLVVHVDVPVRGPVYYAVLALHSCRSHVMAGLWAGQRGEGYVVKFFIPYDSGKPTRAQGSFFLSLLLASAEIVRSALGPYAGSVSRLSTASERGGMFEAIKHSSAGLPSHSWSLGLVCCTH